MKSPFLNKKRLCYIVLLFLFGMFTTTAQNKTLYSQQQIEQHIREVFSDQADILVYGKSTQRLQLITDFFNRITIKLAPEYRGKGFKLLSSLDLLNKYNPNLKRETVFDPENFNALKYQFDIASKNKQVYRVDGTDYIIIVTPFNR